MNDYGNVQFDGNRAEIVPLKVGDHVEISPHYDLWMRGARFGRIVKIHSTHGKPLAVVKMDHKGVRQQQFLVEDLKKI